MIKSIQHTLPTVRADYTVTPVEEQKYAEDHTDTTQAQINTRGESRIDDIG
jgi:hypothetical protein